MTFEKAQNWVMYSFLAVITFFSLAAYANFALTAHVAPATMAHSPATGTSATIVAASTHK